MESKLIETDAVGDIEANRPSMGLTSAVLVAVLVAGSCCTVPVFFLQ